MGNRGAKYSESGLTTVVVDGRRINESNWLIELVDSCWPLLSSIVLRQNPPVINSSGLPCLSSEHLYPQTPPGAAILASLDGDRGLSRSLGIHVLRVRILLSQSKVPRLRSRNSICVGARAFCRIARVLPLRHRPLLQLRAPLIDPVLALELF